MIEKTKTFCVHYRELIVYIIVGGLTTIVGWGSKFLWNIIFYGGIAYPTSLQNAILSVVEWVAGVAFAYPMNRKWVFQSKTPDILKEAFGFVVSRLATLGLNFLTMQLLVNFMRVNFYASTIIAGVLVIVGNYVFSKLFVFRKKE